MADASRPHLVVVLALEGVLALDLGIPVQVFGEELDAYEVRIASPSSTVAFGGGATLAPATGLEALRSADTVIVPGYDRSIPVPEATRAALRAAAARGARMVSICTGAFALAEAGLLDGRPATTHWRHCAALRETFPTVDVDPDVLFVDDGDVLTSAGVAAGIDLCLHLIARDHGAAAANRRARGIVAAPRREGGQAQFIEHAPVVGDDRLAATREWMLRSLHEPVTVRAMAEHSRTSVRTFARRFTASTGSTPLRWLHAQRVERARELLETTDLPVDDVASRSGLGSPANFRVHFKRATGLAPQQYRRAFGRDIRLADAGSASTGGRRSP
ncbi:GlxA family transcriptional regulator [Agromyces sp. MMS24-K17]|uniref:GlxA family transcriptional regulator n=1 Tax=Agromyces sp. MMS24-K17 TaxID=3372850 RepID=UPI00375469CE